MSEPIRIQISESTDETIHTDETGKITKITGLPPQASLKARIAKAKAQGLKVK